MAKTSRYDVLDSRVNCLTNVPPKPEKAGFEEACRQLIAKRKISLWWEIITLLMGSDQCRN